MTAPLVVTKTGAMRELFAVLDTLDTGQLAALTDYARELAQGSTGALVAVDDGPMRALTADDSPIYRLVNSILGLGPDGQRVSSR